MGVGDADRHQRVTERLAEALQLPFDHREGFLEALRRSEPEVHAEVCELLLLAAKPGPALLCDGVIEASRRNRERHNTSMPSAGDVVGGYRLERPIGMGGMGVVWAAMQERPKRRVAIKLVHPHLSSPERLARFRREAEALGRLNHPGIAQILEAGSFAFGGIERPFLALELIDGPDLLTGAERARMDTRARLDLIARIADAVHHAHERGIIHRDLKPDNILLDPQGRPRVLDFGIARIDDTAILSSVMTQDGQILGTVAYMSPEQLSAEGLVTPRTDVYSLGAIAYELLTGRQPHAIAGLPLTAAIDILARSEAPPLGRVDARLTGDIEVVVGKALSKNPDRRYQTMAEFAADLRRHLDHQPILARPPSVTYRASKFVRRHRGLVAGMSLAALSLIGGTVVAVLQAQRAVEGEQLASQRALDAARQSYRVVLGAASSAVDDGRFHDAALDLSKTADLLRGFEAAHLEAMVEEAFGTLLTENDTLDAELVPDGTLVYTTRIAGEDPELVVYTFPDGNPYERHSLAARPLVVPRAALPLALEALSTLHKDGLELDVVEPNGVPLGRFRVAGWQCGSAANPIHTPAVAATPACDRIVLPDVGGSLLCDSSTGTVVATFPGLRLNDLAANGSRAVSFDISSVDVRDAQSGASVWSFSEGTDGFASGALCPDGKYLYTAGLATEPRLRRWSIESGVVVAERRVEGVRVLDPLEVAADGTVVAVAVGRQALHFFDADLERELARFAVPWSAHQRLALDARGERAVMALGASGLRVWDRTAPRVRSVLLGHQSYVYSAAFCPDGRWLASGAWDRSVRVWDVQGQRLLRTFEAVCETGINSVAWSPDGARIYAGSMESLVSIDVASGQVEARLVSMRGACRSLELSPDGQALLVGTDVETRLVHPTTLEFVSQLGSLGLGPATFRPDGGSIATTGSGNQLRVVAARTGLERWTAECDDPVLGLVWSPSGDRIAALSLARIEVRRAHDGALLVEFESPGRDFRSVAWTPEGDRLVVGDFRGGLGFRDSTTGEHLVTFLRHRGYVKDLRFSPDGRTLVSASGDGDLRLWLSTSSAPDGVRTAEPR